MAIPAAAQIRLLWALGIQEGAINVLGAQVTGNPTFDQAFANTIGAAIKSAFTTNFAAQVGAGTSLVRVGVRDLRGDNLPEFRDSGAAAPGTGTGDYLPRQTAACFTLRTAGAGKSFRGRVYFGGFTESVNDANGNTLTAVHTAGVAFLNAINSALQANGLRLGVVSRPAEAYVIQKITTHANGTTTVDTIGRGNARSGMVNAVTVVEARTSKWESQRRRDNSRTISPTLAGAVASVEL